MHYLIADLCPSTDEQLNMLLEEDEGQTQAGGHAGGQAGGQGLAGEQGSVKPLLDKHGTALKPHLSPLMTISLYVPKRSVHQWLPCM